MDVPVLLITFNRPDYVSNMIDAFRKCNVSKLFVFKDGPRSGNTNDSLASKEIEKLIDSIDWNCDIKTNYMQNNLGCGYGPFSAISWAFQYTDELIILEDDCVPTEHFFLFCNEMLERYRNDLKVSLISGFSRLQDHELFKGKDYIFSQYGATLGWATWKRTWDGFDMQLRNLKDFFSGGGFRNQFASNKESKYFNLRYKHFLKDANLYKHSWDIQFGIHSRVNGALRVVPSQSLIQYIGMDGTHYSPNDCSSDIFDFIVPSNFKFNDYPKDITIDKEYDIKYFNKYVYANSSVLYRLFTKIIRFLKLKQI